MKKQRSNNKFLKIPAVSLALLALPPLAVYGQTVRCRAAQPRPALPGVMSDEIRLDPVAGALYRYGVQGGINRADSYWSDNVFTVLRGKLKQAAARGLLSREQLTAHLMDTKLRCYRICCPLRISCQHDRPCYTCPFQCIDSFLCMRL